MNHIALCVLTAILVVGWVSTIIIFFVGNNDRVDSIVRPLFVIAMFLTMAVSAFEEELLIAFILFVAVVTEYCLLSSTVVEVEVER